MLSLLRTLNPLSLILVTLLLKSTLIMRHAIAGHAVNTSL